MKYSLKEIASLTGNIFSGINSEVRRIVTDSRNTFNPSEVLFVAIRGPYHNGHAYLKDLYQRGVRSFLIDAQVDESAYPEAGFVRSVDSLSALQQLATHHRNQFKGQLIGITGSNGKTVTKEWIAQLCPEGVNLFRSPKSYNSQIGVPLSILMLEGDEDIAIIEAGISQPGEMERLERMIRPHIGIFTTLGDAHQENFNTLEQKLSEKLLLFRSTPTILYHLNEPLVKETFEQEFSDRILVPIKVDPQQLIGLQFTDSASRENAAAALTLYTTLGYDPATILPKLPLLEAVAMRLELKAGVEGCKIINDSYNSDTYSLALALDYLGNVSGGQEKVVILSDIQQSGLGSEKLYARVAQMLKEQGVDRLIGIGKEISRHSSVFDLSKDFYNSTEDFLASYDRSRFVNKSVLVKGSRTFHFEKVSNALEHKTHNTVLEINLDYLIHNLNYFRESLREGVRVMGMVKALGYGNGIYEVASTLQHQGVGFLGVAFADEGVALREAGIHMPIVVLNADSDSFELMIEYRLEPEIYSFSSLQSFAQTARRYGESSYPIHLKLDTGMHRLGFVKEEIEPLLSQLKTQKELRISSVFSHLSGSDETRHDDFTREQIDRFKRMSDKVLLAFPRQGIIRHLCNSAGIERFPEAQFDMVRLGIGLYGISTLHQEHLRVVSTLKTRIVQIKELATGETVGYGRNGKVLSASRIATLPIGYADGLDRRLSQGKWSMLLNGKRVPIIGNICMDTCMIDITGIDAQEGDVVIILGGDPALGTTVLEMARILETIPYEVMTNISSRVKRLYTKA